jgi:hypothetical protein
MGSISAWLPSRRSTEHHTGGAVIVLAGQVRSGRLMGGNGLYFSIGIEDIGSTFEKQLCDQLESTATLIATGCGGATRRSTIGS